MATHECMVASPSSHKLRHPQTRLSVYMLEKDPRDESLVGIRPITVGTRAARIDLDVLDGVSHYTEDPAG